MATPKERGQLIDTPKALQSETVTQQLPSKGQDALDKSTNLNFDKKHPLVENSWKFAVIDAQWHRLSHT